ncbi:MAG: hypothetical protein ABL892_01430 [Thiobacillaceae bacterium]
MSVEVAIYFEKRGAEKLMTSLMNLPEALIPRLFSSAENRKIKKNQVADTVRFESFKQRNPAGYFLYADSCTYDLSTHSKEYLVLYVDDFKFDQDYNFIRDIFREALSVSPVFGYAADYDERYHRNRMCRTFGENKTEAWIGRDMDKYIPGVYWYTLLSNALLGKHRVDIADLEAEAISSEALGDGSFHLLKFYEEPDEWKQNADRLDDMCQRIDGMFSKKSVELATANISNYLEYSEIISEWR